MIKKTVVITGGAGGIGKAIAARFADVGYNVVICYHKSGSDADLLCQGINRITQAYAVCADLRSSADICAAFQKIAAKFGGADILINNAGISGIKLFTDFCDTEIIDMLDVNLKGAMLMSKAAIPHMVSNKWGRIINIGSMWGVTGASCEVPYSAAKAGLIGFTKALAKELGPSGITVNCVSPGLINTSMNRAVDAQSLQAIIEATPVCRMGVPEDVAEAVFFLAQNEQGFITGQTLGVDGGLT